MAKKERPAAGKKGNIIGTSNLVNLAACVAVCVSVVVYIVTLILANIGAENEFATIIKVFRVIKDICVCVALGIPTIYYTKGKKKWVRILIYILLIIFIVLAILGNVLV